MISASGDTVLNEMEQKRLSVLYILKFNHWVI